MAEEKNKEKFYYSKALKELSEKYPNNRFYASLSRQYKKRQSLTQKQIACIRKDYSEKFSKKCEICFTKTKSKFDGTRLKDCWVCINCYDKYKLNKRANKLRKKYGSSWLQHVKEISSKSAPTESSVYRVQAPLEKGKSRNFEKTLEQSNTSNLKRKKYIIEYRGEEKNGQKRKCCARCDTIEKKADIDYVGDDHISQWYKKTLCWKCYVDAHVEVYTKYYYCPQCGKKIVEWAGTYEDWAQMRCESGHVVNVNFLVKYPQKKSENLSECRAQPLSEREKSLSREFKKTLKQRNVSKKINKNIFSYIDEEKRR